ncbi:Dual O-methyltransferase/FAD-dependent monooxygenase CTB3 [Pseudocercospora fuligena]|uniref:Dual O-methyltransferase/FAD-dependent monooxygenase CTB3 n=1 Tax=Pseudocercospora fuligena TaxID=685502 RepID=A0A8H6RRV4_9PEZI|nr:Dual O-methyltransferase/FAD-dependent monooxygenase CTB3 [Pseudocercospora fuligena]
MGDQITTSVVIIGAGFGGLLLAQGLRKHNIPFQLFEQEQLSERPKGHRFRIGEDGTEALYATIPNELGDLFTKTCPKLIDPRPSFWDPKTLAKVDILPRPKRPGRGPCAIDRTWVLSLLSLGIEEHIHYDKRFTSYELVANSVLAKFEDGTSIRTKLLVGADGIHSRVRAQLQPTRRLVDMERQMIWARTTITPEVERRYPDWAMRWTALLDQQHPTRNVILEPIMWEKNLSILSNGRLPSQTNYIYWALSSELPTHTPRTIEELKAFVGSITENWDHDFCSLFRLADWDLAVRARILSSKPDIGHWSGTNGRVTLIGDAAHPMSPQGGLGGNTVAITAADLSRTLGQSGINEESIIDFENRMRATAKEALDTTFASAKFMWNGKEWYEYEEVENR